MAIYNLLLAPLLAHPILSVILLPLALLLLRSIYRVSPFHPLSHIPGPLIARVSSLWLTYHAWIGDEATLTKSLHEKYGSVVRTGPNSVDIDDGAALASIYTEKGGFVKPEFYANFDIDGHQSIFSETDPQRRAPRAKAVATLFSTTNLRQGQDIIYKCVDRLVARLSEGKTDKRGKPLNVLNLTRGLAVDAVTSYLLGNTYGALDENGVRDEKNAVKKEVAGAHTPEEHEEGMSASGMVDCFVAVGRFWYLPRWAFALVESLDAWWNGSDEVSRSLSRVDAYVSSVVSDAEAAIAASKANEKPTTHPLTSYPARLLQAGFSPSETRAQCKDLMFAGTDSTGMNLATILHRLALNPEHYKRLREEVLAADPSFDDLQSLPYLRGVVKEGLRLSMANPSRLPRVVPASGWTFKNTYFPPGTVVGCSPLVLHLNPEVFEEPDKFKPERWFEPTEAMLRDSIPFGLGARQCIARNLATVELFCAVERVARANVLNGVKAAKDKIEILEWFNSKVVGERIDLVWE